MTIIAQPIAADSSRNYAWLQSKVARWIKRTDLSADIPDFVMLAEKRISGDLEARLQNMTDTLATVGDSPTVALPDGFNGIRSLSIANQGGLTPMTPEKLANAYTNAGNGVPKNYAIVGDVLRLGPVPDAVYQMDIVYRAEIPALADSADGTNWLIADHPEIYLAATMCEALLYTRDTANLQVWTAKYTAAINALNVTDWNSASSMVVRSDTVTP
jgi:hypothetical protein